MSGAKVKVEHDEASNSDPLYIEGQPDTGNRFQSDSSARDVVMAGPSTSSCSNSFDFVLSSHKVKNEPELSITDDEDMLEDEDLIEASNDEEPCVEADTRTGRTDTEFNGRLCEISEMHELSNDVRSYLKKLTEAVDKLRLKILKQKRRIRALQCENKQRTIEMDQIKDLNIKLQIRLDNQRLTSDVSFTPVEASVQCPPGVKLTAFNQKELQCSEIGEKGDASFILKLLLAMYTREELCLKSVTGMPSRNKNYVQDAGERFSPEKLQFIKAKFRERVAAENPLPSELERRCRDEYIHKLINTKIQNLKRAKSKTLDDSK